MSAEVDIFTVRESPEKYSLVFSSTMANIDRACQQVNQFLKSKDIHIDPHWFAINLVLREGLTNAVRHGNQGDSQKQVRLALDLSVPDLLRMTIEDQGDGFNRPDVFEMDPPEELDHGRGITIMEKYFTRCSYNNKGNILFLEKRLLG